ncbi:hypothetical protein CEX93_22605 [Xanthomonas euvesicatoria]|nr:hypothetical protein XaclCFBP3371_12240 [Xanthomonas euvesicatoria pv. citrumelonis]PWH21023.1 hypothetical protein CEX93_22605 [Xanthomonas euvesicatoria]PWH23298.1 hypothetical protein CDO09_12355 [Xanthomonas perforans]
MRSKRLPRRGPLQAITIVAVAHALRWHPIDLRSAIARTRRHACDRRHHRSWNSALMQRAALHPSAGPALINALPHGTLQCMP